MLAESPRTADGTIVGTVSYMSPEQAEGKPVDHRSDIFSFGALLYEMLTGRRAFQGESTVSTLAAILTTEPAPLSAERPASPPSSPGSSRGACESAGEALAEHRRRPDRARGVEAGPGLRPARSRRSPVPHRGAAGFPSPRRRSSRRRWLDSRVAGAAGRAGARTVAVSFASRRMRARAYFPAISRDGKLVTYVSDRAAGERMDSGCSRSRAAIPCSSRGSRRLPRSGVLARRQQDRAALRPRTRRHLCRPDVRRAAEASWPKGNGRRFSPDGSQISYVTAAVDRTGSPPSLWIVPADGGKAKELKPGKGISAAPVWQPGRQGPASHRLQRRQDAQNRDWYFVPADGGAVTPTGAIERLRAAGFGLGRDLSVTDRGVLFSHGTIDSTNIYRMPFDAAFQKASGDPVPVIVGAGFNFSPTASQDGRRIAFAVGNNLLEQHLAGAGRSEHR